MRQHLFWIDILRVLAIFAVVALHATVETRYMVPLSLDWHVGNLIHSATRLGVPLFVLISGSLLLRPTEETTIEFYRKRFKRLVIPFIFWSVFFIIYADINNASNDSLSLVQILYEDLKSILAGYPYYHMWFLFMLCGLYVLTPYIRQYLQHASRPNVWQLTIILSFFAMANTLIEAILRNNATNTAVSFSPYYLGYFLIGYLLVNRDISRIRLRYIGAIIIFAYAFIVVATIITIQISDYRGYWAYSDTMPSTFALAICVFMLIQTLFRFPQSHYGRFGNVVTYLASRSLGIYLIHPLVLEFIGKTPIYTTPRPAVAMPLVAVFTFVGSLVIVQLLSLLPGIRKTVM